MPSVPARVRHGLEVLTVLGIGAAFYWRSVLFLYAVGAIAVIALIAWFFWPIRDGNGRTG